VLERCRDAVTPALQAAVERLDDTSRAQSRYHLGWVEVDGSPGRGGGKAVRPALALLSAEAAGAPTAAGLPGAVAVELVHNFSLLHDDLMDGDTERRHRPTVWARWGAASAILTGDAMLALASEVLLEAPTPHAARAAHLLATTVRELVRGQAEDVGFESRADVGVEECLAMAAGKTGSLLATSASIGAVLAGAPAGLAAALHTFGAELGAAFQLVDDLLGIWGDPERTGKPAGSDLRQRKKTLPVVAALASGADEAIELRGLLSDGHLDEAQVERAVALVEACGARSWTANRAKAHMDTALGALNRVRMNPLAHRELSDLAAFVVERES
jgi:geranylgeranyl diphosphate synthase, type I